MAANLALSMNNLELLKVYSKHLTVTVVYTRREEIAIDKATDGMHMQS